MVLAFDVNILVVEAVHGTAPENLPERVRLRRHILGGSAVLKWI